MKLILYFLIMVVLLLLIVLIVNNTNVEQFVINYENPEQVNYEKNKQYTKFAGEEILKGRLISDFRYYDPE